MLTPSQSDELRRQLESELGRLVANAQHAIGFTMDRDRDRIGRDSIDESVEEELYSTQLRLHDRETFLIVKIQDALKRLDAGEIDDCEECSEPIGFRRLMARPMTTLCVDCKTAREQAEAEDTGE